MEGASTKLFYIIMLFVVSFMGCSEERDTQRERERGKEREREREREREKKRERERARVYFLVRWGVESHSWK